MATINKYGLSRDIPSDVKRAVRQRDGFGCVVCGLAFIKYEHLDPEFHEAKSHDAQGIVSLCGGCENKRTKGVLSVETIKEAAKKPRSRQIGFSREYMDIGRKHPELIAGSLVGRNCKVFLRVCGEDVISVLPPEEEKGPFRINALIRDRYGAANLEIIENEWRTPTGNWDVETIGSRIIIRQAPQSIAMILRLDPPNRIVFERLDFAHRGTRIFVAGDQEFTIVSRAGAIFTSGGWESDGATTLVEATEGGALMIGRGGTAICHFARLGGGGTLRRNSLCFCGANKRYKHCHGRLG